MKRIKIIYAAIGGVTLLAALVLGYLLFGAMGDRTGKVDELSGVKAAIERILHGDTEPCQASVDAIRANVEWLKAWQSNVTALAARGDVAVRPDVTPSAFKQQLIDESAELRALQGAGGNIADDEFKFGFGEYIGERSKMPEADRIENLQRNWEDVKFFVRTLSECGIVQVTEVAVLEPKVKRVPQETPKKVKKGKRKSAAEDVKAEVEMTVENYQLKFTARPAAVPKVIGRLTACERFVAIDSFSLTRATDEIRKIVGDKEEDQTAAARPKRKRGRGRAAAEETDDSADGEKKKGFAYNPDEAQPLTVTIALTVSDFGTGVFSEESAPAEPEVQAESVTEVAPAAEEEKEVQE